MSRAAAASQIAPALAREGEAPQLFEASPFEDGFSWRTVIGALFVGLVMLPGAIYMGLISGASIAGAAEWVTIILFIEIGKRSFIQMKKQEIILLFWVAAGLLAAGATFGSGVTLFGGPFGSKIWDQFLVQSPQAEGFGIADKIPWWFVPRDPKVLITRSFFHWEWAVPIALLVLHVFLSYALMLSLGYSLYRLTNDVERLEFPLAPVNAGGATALAETSGNRETWRWRVFSIGAMIGVGFGAIYLGVPTVTGVLASQPIMLLPIPFVDWTAAIGNTLPSALLGIVPDLALVLVGFVLPLPVVIGSFLGSICLYVIGNPIFQRLGVLSDWEPGLDVRNTDILAKIDLWISVGIGMAIFVALLGVISVARQFAAMRARKTRRDQEHHAYLESIKARGHFPLGLSIVIVVLCTLSYVVFTKILVPGFPTWILLVFGFVVSPLVSYVQARMIGITGTATGVSFPYVREGTFILSGYRGIDVWFAPLPLYTWGGGAQQFKQLELTRSKFKGLVKAQAMAAVIMLVCSFFFWSLIWSLAPIPSEAYPYVQRMWPYFATNQSLWVSSTLASDKLETEQGNFEINPLQEDVAKRWPDLDTSSEAARQAGITGELFDARGAAPESAANRARGTTQGALGAMPGGPSERSEPRDDGHAGGQGPGALASGMARQLDTLSTRADLHGRIALEKLPPGGPATAPADPAAVLWVVSGAAPNPAEQKQLTRLSAQRTAQYWVSAQTAGNLTSQIPAGATVSVKPRRSFLKEAITKAKVGGGFIAAAVLWAVTTALRLPTGVFYGFVGGQAIWPHYVIPQMIGALLGRYWLRRKFGEKTWKAYTPILLAGYACGSGLVAMLAIGFALLAKAISRVII
jgi:hypothetical protein